MIQILLSTYNGEKFLKEQLDSFRNQTLYSQVKVLIRDDGSNDGTVSILKEYQSKYGFEIIEGTNVGVNFSILELFKSADLKCEYFAISDQDDVWLNEKLEIALGYISGNEGEEEPIPVLFGSLSKVVDESLNPIGETQAPQMGVNFNNAVIQNVIPGHTQVFNRELLKRFQHLEKPEIHVIDWWIYLTATAIGKVYFHPYPTVLHRQHANNSVGYTLNPLKKTLQRVSNIKNKKGNAIAIQLMSFLKSYSSELSEELIVQVSDFFESQKTIFSRLIYVFRSKFYRQTRLETLIFKLLYLVGKYNL